ncbi:type II secretion system protein GspL [Salinisphaera sp. LB1]|uniref:type II secretion system protein GspL n=1 Tax=Salinisphaera sp. LB1 TaxID=2183911 RepID=UPI000D7D2717|nr:type II secretion system protein GspL [Salinisphaera sp. LB1]AWN17303.1 General secretion pathway protein L [Salinisphaera sp. LB1]
MAQRLAVYFDGTQAAWLDDERQLTRGSLAEFAAAIEGEDAEISVLIPGEDVLLTRAPLPPIRTASRRLQAARYALEDRLAGRVEQLHFALAGSADRAGGTPVAVIDLDRMTTVCDALDAAGIEATRILPDYMALPAPGADHWQLAASGDRVLARTEATAGFACDTDLWPIVAGALDAPMAATVYAIDAAEAQRLLAIDWAGDAESPALHLVVCADADALVAMLLAEPEALRGGANLRQGAFAPRSQFQSQWRPLMLTGALAAAWLVIAIVARGIETWQLDQRVDALHAQTLAAFHDAFPGVQNINDLRVQAEQGIRQLRGKGGAGGLFPLVQAVAAVTGQTDDLQVQSMQYRNGKLNLSLNGKNVKSVETLRAGFAQRDDIQLSVQGADASASGVQIRATVSPGASQ